MTDIQKAVNTAAEKIKNVFSTLFAIDVTNKIKEKNSMRYLSWSSAWAETKKVYPDATYKVYPQVMDEFGNTRFWHDDGRTGWVELGVTIEGLEHIETLAIMDFKNKSIPADQITSVDANKSLKRCLTKACALHGLALHIYEGEELNENTSMTIELKEKIASLVEKKCKLSDNAKEKVSELCKKAEKLAFQGIDDDLIRGNYKNIDDVEILKNLETQLMAVRK